MGHTELPFSLGGIVGDLETPLAVAVFSAHILAVGTLIFARRIKEFDVELLRSDGTCGSETDLNFFTCFERRRCFEFKSIDLGFLN